MVGFEIKFSIIKMNIRIKTFLLCKTLSNKVYLLIPIFKYSLLRRKRVSIIKVFSLLLNILLVEKLYKPRDLSSTQQLISKCSLKCNDFSIYHQAR